MYNSYFKFDKMGNARRYVKKIIRREDGRMMYTCGIEFLGHIVVFFVVHKSQNFLLSLSACQNAFLSGLTELSEINSTNHLLWTVSKMSH